MKIVVVGEEAAGARVVSRVAESGHELVGVFSSGRAVAGTSPATAAAAAGVPVDAAGRVRRPELAEQLRELAVDVLLNVHSLHVICPAVLAAPRVGAFNLHPGPLPAYAGLNTPSWAIAAGETRHAVTLHWMEPGIDTGDVVSSARFDVTGDDTGLSVSMRCAQLGLGLIDELLARLATDPAAVPRHPQNLGDRRYYGREVPRGGWIPWTGTARQVTDFARACDYRPFPSPWGSPRAQLDDGRELEVIKVVATGWPTTASPGLVGADNDSAQGASLVATGDEWVRPLALRIDGQTHPAADVLETGQTLHGALPDATPRATPGR